MRIEFRLVKTDGPTEFWHVELYCDEGNMFPVGTAYVVSSGNGHAQMNFILVADQWRKLGYGKALVAAMVDRWPRMVSTSPMGKAGAALVKQITRATGNANAVHASKATRCTPALDNAADRTPEA